MGKFLATKKVVAITGANGFIGKKLVAALSKHENITMRLLVRKKINDNDLPNNVTLVKGDLTKLESLDEFLVPNCIVINLAYVFNTERDENIIATKNLIKTCRDNNIERLIHCSTASVFGRITDDVVSESTACNPGTDYAKSKLMIEELLKSGSKDNYEYVSIRPTEVYGSNGKAMIKLVKNLMFGSQILNYIKSCLFNSRTMNLVHVSNVVAAIEFLIDTDKDVSGETYIVSEDDSPLNNYLYVEKYLVERLTTRHYFIPTFPFPSFILSLLLRFLRRDSVNPYLMYDSSKIKNIGFKYVRSFDSGLDEMSDWFLRNLKDHH